jgi:ribosomal protein S19E (S16A)
LESEGFVKKVEKGVHKGKIITPKGQSFLDKFVKNGLGGNKKTEAARTATGTDAKTTE